MFILIDLHSHILPGVDDGSPDLKTSLNLAQIAVEQGIDKMLLTPHHMDGKYINNKKSILEKTESFQSELNNHNIPLEVRAGQELHLNGDLLNAIEQDNILFADEQQHYMMLELPHNEVPEYTNDMVFELQLKGITPVIVHPERNRGLQKAPDKLYELVEHGCLTQLTASSYLGDFGKKVQKFTNEIIKANLGFTFASDAHNLAGRNFKMKQAYDLLRKNNYELSIKYQQIAQSIWNGKAIQSVNISRIHSKSRLENLIHRLF
ncbi:tyrosine protein phosphatase [Apilactobacillus timberlakei]|nr:CpsB/CapC family capsule biosynthesis tyrosine phosphatase [Apilactobacillus timberlakei]TPR18894.1 tyrosine protein phosphatase [Apilactobacillus timberlakei]TPR20942.1 tyrosine protein phosphatase [Apilactobacillus timberlakei]TPR23593.1 tyrosine protein phosphatase [Apilactobacillus timberlakei]